MKVKKCGEASPMNDTNKTRAPVEEAVLLKKHQPERKTRVRRRLVWKT
jgi:hypothetical protein